MKKILTLVLALVMLASAFAILPASAADEVDEGWTVLLNSGIVLNYYEGGEKVDSVSVAAKEMAKSQTVGNKTISVVEYLEGLLAGEYGENTKKLATALINYGAAAYDYFDAQGKCEDLPEVDGEPVTDTAALKGVEAPAVGINDADGIYLGATLVLDGTMKLRFYFKGTGLEGYIQDNEETAINCNGSVCYFEAEIMPYELGESVTVTVGNTTVTYAPINYLQAKADDPVLSSMVASIYAYGVAAKTYSETDGCEHKGDFEFEIIKPATLFTEGEKKNYCAICGDYIDNSNIAKSNVEAEKFSTETSGQTLDYHTFDSILDGGKKHFYPTKDDSDGKALYIEYSMLWTEEFVNASIGAQDYMLLGRFDSAADNYDGNYDTAYALTIGNSKNGWTDNKTPGYFDYLGNNVEFVHGNYTYGSNAENCPSIGGYGWHRIGIVIKQIDNSRLNATLYVDGVKLSSHNITPRNTDNLLYTKENGEYKDIDLNRVVRAYYFGDSVAEAEVEFKYADLYVTAGDGFVLPVKSLDTPTAKDGFDGNFYFEYTCPHPTLEYTQTKAPTMFSEGLEEGTCSYCEETLTKTVDKESVKIHTFTTDVRHNYSDYYYFDSILDGGHFYPTEENRNGQSLYIEYSMLWSEEFVNASIGKGYMLLGRFDPQEGYDVDNYDIAYALSIGETDTWTDHGTPGHFDVLGKDGAPVDGDYTYTKPNASTFPSIGGYGWHRIGIVIKQVEKGGEYLLNATLYIDGVMLSSHNISPRNTANLLYTVENGEYKDIDLTRCITPYYFGDTNTVGGTADFEIADLYVTAGTDFVLPVAKLTDPRRVTYTDLDGNEHTDITYFGYGDDIPGEPYDPEVCTHPNAEYVPTKVNTMFSEGLEEGTCPDCDEPVSRNIPMTEITTQVVTRSSGSHDDYRWFHECHFLKDLVSEDNHFYDENNSLYIEYSILVNESFNATVWRNSNAAWFILGTIGNTSGADDTLDKIGWLHRDANDDPACPYVGGVEPNGDVTKFYEDNGIVEKQGDYYVMKEELYYGWHRIGVKIDQTHEGKGNSAEYTVTATIFIDGERIMDMVYEDWMEDYLLYTVDENGVCHDTDNGEAEVTTFVLQKLVPKNSSDKIYIPVADTHVTCGSGFVLPVTKLDDSIEDTYSPEDGVTLDADWHFAYVD